MLSSKERKKNDGHLSLLIHKILQFIDYLLSNKTQVYISVKRVVTVSTYLKNIILMLLPNVSLTYLYPKKSSSGHKS